MDGAESSCDHGRRVLLYFYYSPSSSGIGGDALFSGRFLMVAMEQVAVFFDFQNVHLVGRDRFDRRSELYRCVPDPVRLADLIVTKRRRPSLAADIRVYRGRPDPERQPRVAAANDAQAAEWAQDRRVTMRRRMLNYRGWPRLPGQEKGVDVAIAVDLMTYAFRRDYDALVLFSSDTDLIPALESIIDMRLGHVEVACWDGAPSLRLGDGRPSRPWCHWLTGADWDACTDDWGGRV